MGKGAKQGAWNLNYRIPFQTNIRITAQATDTAGVSGECFLPFPLFKFYFIYKLPIPILRPTTHWPSFSTIVTVYYFPYPSLPYSHYPRIGGFYFIVRGAPDLPVRVGQIDVPVAKGAKLKLAVTQTTLQPLQWYPMLFSISLFLSVHTRIC